MLMNRQLLFCAFGLILAALMPICACRDEFDDQHHSSIEIPAQSESFKDKNMTAQPSASPTVLVTSVPSAEPTVTPEPSPSPFPGTEYMPLTYEEKTRLVNFDNPLPESFVPRDLVSAKELLGDICALRKEDSLIQYEVGLRLRELFIAAYDEGMGEYRVCDPYRTQEYQASLWDSRVSMYPDYGKNPYEEPVGVMPGNASEHCAGLAVDVCSTAHPSLDVDFSSTAEGKWLIENAHRFGFIFRYPADKTHITGVKCEPWHIRYVGIELAEAMYGSEMCLEEFIGVNMG